MNGVASRHFTRIFRIASLGAVSPLALLLGLSPLDQARAQDRLPAVTVDAPTAPKVRRASRPAQAAPARRRGGTATAATPRAVPGVFPAPSRATVGVLPAAYAGGQVATGGSLGLLGNRGVMDTPFNQTSYTAALIQNQQARTIRDVLANDPSVRTIQAAGGGADSLFIRGFYYDSGDYALNGLYGIAPYYSTAANYIERVEVLKGPSALLNGMTVGGTGASSAGAVGGSVNLISKHAPDTDITQVTGTYASKSQFGAQTDISRRYGEQKEWGIRLNSAYANGNTPWNRQTDENGNVVLGLDYRGERVRVSADLGYQADNLKAPMRFFTLGSAVLPDPPKSGTNTQPSWSRYQPKDTFGTLRGEVDLNDWATAYAAFGAHDSTIDYTYVSPTITGTTLRGTPLTGHETYRTYAGEAGLRLDATTGPVQHAINVGYAINDRTYNQKVFTPATGAITWNLYSEPTGIAAPSFTNLAANQQTHVQLWSVGVSDTMSLWDKRLQFTVGVRRQTAGSSVDNYFAPASSRAETDTSVWTPAYAVVLRPVEAISLYANYIEGLQTPVVVGSGFSNSGTVFPPGQTKQSEAGIKIDAGRLTATMSAFDISRPSAITVAGTPLPSQQLNGIQRNRGVELNLFGEVTPSLRLLGGLALIHGVQEKTAGGATDGKVAIGVPSLTLNLGTEWDTPFLRDLTLTGRVIYTARQYADVGNTVALPDWTRFDVGARYTFTSPWNGKPIVLRANVENVFNKAYWASAYSGVLTLGAPRTYLVSTTFNF